MKKFINKILIFLVVILSVASILVSARIISAKTYSWNLPEIFCDIITYHHSPMQSYKYNKESCIVYVANIIITSITSNKNLNIDNIPLDILENLNISGDNIIEIHEELVNIAKDINDINSFFE